jgi:hypothetical protein
MRYIIEVSGFLQEAISPEENIYICYEEKIRTFRNFLHIITAV